MIMFLPFVVAWEDWIKISLEEDVLNWESDEMRERIKKAVFDYDIEDEVAEEEERFRTSAKIQALVALADPVAHMSMAARKVAVSTRWNFAPTYFKAASEFHGTHVSGAVDVQGILEKKPRCFDKKVLDPVNVSSLNFFVIANGTVVEYFKSGGFVIL